MLHTPLGQAHRECATAHKAEPAVGPVVLGLIQRQGGKTRDYWMLCGKTRADSMKKPCPVGEA